MSQLPLFVFDLGTYLSELEGVLNHNLKKMDELLTQTHFTWENLMRPLEEMDDLLEQFWSPFAHFHAVKNNTELRKVYEACLPKLTAYEASIGQNDMLFQAIKKIDRRSLNSTQIKIIEDTLLDFTLAGVALPEKQKERFEAIQLRLSQLKNTFSNHVLDAGLAFQLEVQDETQLKGLPEHALQTAKKLAEEQGKEGWILNLEFPCYLAVVTYAEDRKLRETLYQAYVTRASDQGPYAGEFDNTPIMEEILALRHEKAVLLGYPNYAELSLATKMAHSSQQVMDFLLDLVARVKNQAQQEVSELQEFARTHLNLADLKPWDIAYASEKLRVAQYAISQEDLREYFPLSKVLEGIFAVIKQLYKIRCYPVADLTTWHKDVLVYALEDREGTCRGYLYLDLFARPHKQGGAWMDSLKTRRKLVDGSIQLPIATLTCNFAKAGQDSLLSHEEVLTLFHEFGHCLHHLLTKVDYLDVSGTHGVEWDAVELPSQIFENWCWEPQVLALLSRHQKTGETLPTALYQKLLAAKNFHSGLAMIRQLEFSLFDFCIHKDYEPTSDFIIKTLAEVRKQTAVLPTAAYNRFQNSFSHIFAGGYAAGYYSYKWAEVLSSDAYARFEEEGILNQATGDAFLKSILEVGGSIKAEEAFRQFRGRDPQIQALLRHNGIKAT